MKSKGARVHPGIEDERRAHRLLMQPIEHTMISVVLPSNFTAQENEPLRV